MIDVSLTFSGYIAIQFGFTAFSFQEIEGENSPTWKYRSYNFFVFPQLRKQRFECQGESMAFLGSNNFDFNTLFREGLSYCDEDEAKRLREQFNEKLKSMETADKKNNGDEQIVAVPIEEREHLDRLRYLEGTFKCRAIRLTFRFDYHSNEIEEFLKSDDDEKLVGKTCNAFQRKLIYQLLEQRYRETISASSQIENNQKVRMFNFCTSRTLC